MITNLIRNFFKVPPSTGRALKCPVCNKKTTYAPLPACFVETAYQHGFKYYDKWEMLSLSGYGCNTCGASDRERIYALWIEQQIEKRAFANGSHLIHFAPEAALSKKIKGLDFFDYNTADLFMDGVDYKVDMMGLPFDDDSFDFFICSHVLEHVESDDQAIKELYRITKPGGCGILVAPILLGLKKTKEDSSVIDEIARWRLYGQNDHVRLYAHDDYVCKIRHHGFQVEELGVDYFGEGVFRTLGLSDTSILYVVRK